MKKIFMFIVLLAATFTLTSCGFGNSPEGVAEKGLKYLKNGDYESFVDLCYLKSEDGESAENQKQMLVALLKEKASKNPEAQDIDDFEVLSSTENQDGNKAVVKYKIKYNSKGEYETETMNLVKDDNGDWKINLGK